MFFEPIQGLGVSHISILRERWKGAYPNTAELPPLRPHMGWRLLSAALAIRCTAVAVYYLRLAVKVKTRSAE